MKQDQDIQVSPGYGTAVGRVEEDIHRRGEWRASVDEERETCI